MDIRTKLIFALVAVALGSLFVFGAVIAPGVGDRMRVGTLERLDELAEAKREALLLVVEGWRDRTRLVASRTQLRSSVAAWEDGAVGPSAEIERILRDALESSETMTLLRVLDPAGVQIASAATPEREPRPSAGPAERGGAESEIAYLGVAFAGDRPPQVTFSAPITAQGRTMGSLLAVFEARELVELTGHYHGLGETGEVLIVAPDASGAPRTLPGSRAAEGGV